MFEDKRNYIWLRILSGILLLVVLTAGGFMLYRAGFSHGALNAGGDAVMPGFAQNPHGMFYYPRSHFFFPGGIFFGLLFFFLIFGLFRRMLFGPRWGMHRMHGMNQEMWKDRAEKWHAEMHTRMEGNPPGSPDDAPETKDA